VEIWAEVPTVLRTSNLELVADVTVQIEVIGVVPLSFGKYHDEPNLSNEKPLAYEKRTYSEKLHFLDNGELYVPAMMFKKSLDAACRRCGEKIPGRGQSTYTKFFESACIPAGDFPLKVGNQPILKDNVPGEKLFVPSDGVAGSGKRVTKYFPKIEEWECYGEFLILDNIIDPDTFMRMLKHAGTFIGLGRWRPQNAGLYGRFAVNHVFWNGKAI
jgi:hypothetical protein